MSEELPLESAARWEVVAVHHKQTKDERKRKAPLVVKHYELRHGADCHEKATTAPDIERLRAAAKFMNSRGIPPRRPIECLADIGGSLDNAMSRQTKLADRLTAEGNKPEA